MVVNTLREWRLACPMGDLDLVFPTGRAQIEHHSNVLRALAPVMIELGITDNEGRLKYFAISMQAGAS
jgi:hypothetical protein